MLLRFKSERYGTIYVKKRQYGSGRMALQLMQPDGQLLAVLTVNIPEMDKQLRPGEFFVKTWSENKEIAEEARKSGLFVDSGRRVKSELVEAQIWRFGDGVRADNGFD
jgi:hypothetical protein